MEKLLNSIVSEQGAIVAFSLLVILGLVKLYMMERGDRQEAWKSHNELVDKNTDALSEINIVLTTLVELVRDHRDRG